MALAFILKATPEQLLELAAGTALRGDPLVTNFNNQRTEELRGRIAKEYRRHADFRGMVIRAVARMQPAGIQPEPDSGPSAPKSGDGGKPKKGRPS